MNVVPVIERELRATARQGTTYWLRVGGAAAAILAVGMFTPALLLFNLKGAGTLVFAMTHRVVFFSIWLGVPWLVGDCISRERREGTLGLLFLTPLRPSEIVVAKALVHGLRALSLWLTVLPIMALAFLIGGVGWREAAMSAAVNFSALCIALGAGLLATSFARRWLRAMVLASLLTVPLLIVFLIAWDRFSPLFSWTVVSTTTSGVLPWTGINGPFRAGVVLSAGSTNVRVWAHPFQDVAIRVVLSVFWLGCMIFLAAIRLNKLWQEEPPPAWIRRLNEVFCQPRFWQGLFRRWMKRQIERNPIGWLEQRAWTSRVVVWSWFAVIVSFYSAVFGNSWVFRRSFDDLQLFLSCGLLLFLSFSAAGSFRRERETGLLELLLVAPVSEARVIGGRLRGLWGRFMPSFILVAFVWMSFPMWTSRGVSWPSLFFVFMSYLSVPVIGLYQSLRRRHFLPSLLWTLGLAFVLPILAPTLVLLPLRLAEELLVPGISSFLPGSFGGNRVSGEFEARLVVAGVAQCLLAVVFGGMLYGNLVQRKFLLEQSGDE